MIDDNSSKPIENIEVKSSEKISPATKLPKISAELSEESMQVPSYSTVQPKQSVIWDLLQHKYKQQQDCWQYAKIQDDENRTSTQKILIQNFNELPPFLDFVLELWKSRIKKKDCGLSTKKRQEGHNMSGYDDDHVEVETVLDNSKSN